MYQQRGCLLISIAQGGACPTVNNRKGYFGGPMKSRNVIKIFLLFVGSLNFSRVNANVLFIDIEKEQDFLQIFIHTNENKKVYVINDAENIFKSCNTIDTIVSRRGKGNKTIIGRLEKEINFLSAELLKPVKKFILNHETINVKISESSVKIPFEFLRINNEFLYRTKPIIYSYNKLQSDDFPKVDLNNGFIITDLTADPENACSSINKKYKNSYFNYIENVNIDSIKKAKGFDFLLMSVHGIIDINSCQGHIKINNEKLYPSAFSQKNLKLVYFDSCHLGKAKNFVDRFHSLDAQYYLGPIISNEAGNSSTKTILTFFDFLENNNPAVSLMKTKQKLRKYSNNNILVELWFAAAFRIYKLS